MSAPFFKIFSGVFLAHVVALSVIWVGFSSPAPRPSAAFIYEGALPAEDNGRGPENVWSKNKISVPLALEHAEDADFNHWAVLRRLSKSYAYLGF